MGNSESVEVPGGGTDGYHILRVQENSPGSKAGLQPFFDFIISINGVRLDRDNDTLKQILKNGIGKQLPMTIYSCKTQSVRSVTVEPSDTWGGQGLLGISIKFCSFEIAKENVWHVLEVHSNSPASLAGLRPFTDYIIGTDSILHESEDLFNLIENHDGVSMKLYVYNSQDDSCREVTITPNSQWGGVGLLGCGIGYGYLHRIPVRGTPPPVTTIYKSVNTEINPPSDVNSITTSTANLSLISSEVAPSPPPSESQNISGTNSNIVEPQINPILTGSDVTSQYNLISNENTNVPVYTSNLPPPSSVPQFSNMYYPQQSLSSAPVSNVYSPPSNTTPTSVSVDQVPMYQVPASSESANPYATGNIPSFNYFSQPLPMQAPSMNYTQSLSMSQTNTVNTVPPQTAAVSVFPDCQNPIIFDPAIAARSAQQLLSGNLPSSS
ncbi:unnamed protein product [Acanthoscelides obtectus]|uniref:PDZ GRASP-type domain-containing protein n=1 Tax=Acanthoscelides obtectus TaxID=200917 RepID=A0A9P0L9G2_ACAOB|nr:unnamed protein product [Acanthoscelides obtectus]CAK1673289.1 Golgi reassembly-stacking protein 2 [Acanthoscelides obtectus]